MQEAERSERTSAAPQAQAGAEEKPAASETTEQQAGETTATAPPVIVPAEGKRRPRSKDGPDWLAVEAVTVVGLLFAIIARLNIQPSTALVPVAVLAAPGCGLLVTAIRKLRTLQRPGLLEAALSGAILALCHLGAALTYPSVLSTLLTQAELRLAFLSTWGLITIFALVLSLVGAVLGHLAFAPLRPVPARAAEPTGEQVAASDQAEAADDEQVTVVSLRHGVQDEEEEKAAQAGSALADSGGEETKRLGAAEELSAPVDQRSDEELGAEEEEQEQAEEAQAEPEETGATATGTTPARRSLLSYAIAVLFLALLPTVVGYLFAAAYDAMFVLYQFAPGPFPTLRLLSALLPWQVPIHIDLSRPDAALIIFSLLWRIPLFLGNGTMFDVLALEPLVLNGAALALLLLSTYGYETPEALTASREALPLPSWSHYLLLTALLGLGLVLAPDLWVFQGLAGLLQIPHADIALPLRTLRVLDPLTFSLNLVTGPLLSLLLALLLRWQYGRARAIQSRQAADMQPTARS